MNLDFIVETISVDEADANVVERYLYEYTGLQALVNQFCSDTEFKPDMERLNKVIEEYLIAYASYNVIWSDLLRRYVSPEYYLDEKYSIELSVVSSAFIVKLKNNVNE